jgi:hypothetical protein
MSVAAGEMGSLGQLEQVERVVLMVRDSRCSAYTSVFACVQAVGWSLVFGVLRMMHLHIREERLSKDCLIVRVSR